MSIIKKLLPSALLFVYVRDLLKFAKYKAYLLLALLFFLGMIKGASIMLLIPLLHFAGIIEHDSAGGISSQFMQFLQDLSFPLELPYVLFLYIAIIATQSFLKNWQQILSTQLCQGFICHKRNHLYKMISQANWSFVLQSRDSDLTHILTNGIEQVGMGTSIFFFFVNNVNIAITHTIIAFIISPAMTLYAIICGIVLFLLLKPLNHRVAKTSQKLYGSNQKVYNFVCEYLRGIKVAKSHGEESMHMRRFEAESNSIKDSQVEFTRFYCYTQIGYELLSVIIVSVLFYVAIEVVHVSISSLILLLFVFSRLQPQITSLQRSYQNILQMLPAYKGLQELQHKCLVSQTSTTSVNKNLQLQKYIKFEKVYFSYNKKHSIVLHDVNLTIPVKKVTAIVGPSGSGKTTIIDLLLGLLSPNQGQILIDNTPLTSKYFASWRKQIGYVSQDNFIYHNTVRNNLVMSQTSISDAEIWHTLQLVAADVFVGKLPQGLDSVIGDGGTGFSGGERQRLILARTLLRKPSLLILDEALNAVDSENIKHIQSTINKLHGKSTIVVITHRLDTLQHADQIIVIEKGIVVEQGQYKNLSSTKSSRFYHLLHMPESALQK